MWLSRGARALWNGRDTRGHYTDADTVAEAYPATPVCHHACCKGKRAHPAGLPVMRAKTTTSSARKPAKKPARKRAPARNALGETPWVGRAQTTAQRKATTAAGARAEYDAYLESQYRAAERATKGYMVTPAGRARGYSGRDFFKAGRRPSLERWGTEELRAWFGSGSAASTGRKAGGRVLTLSEFTSSSRAA
jgi:hypothetical protein